MVAVALALIAADEISCVAMTAPVASQAVIRQTVSSRAI